MVGKLRNIQGMNDLLPAESGSWQIVEEKIFNVFKLYGYKVLATPVLEYTELFKRSIGEVTDIVEKEMYTFSDLNGESLTLRPEGTAGCVRAVLANDLLYNFPQLKVCYSGPMFRHERPQKGRYRQFHQMGIEAFGMSGPDIDAEVIIMSARLLKELGLQKHACLQLNTIGTLKSRQLYKESLKKYFSSFEDQLDDDSRRRLQSNPFRILDSKNKETQKIVAGAPLFQEYLDKESAIHFDRLQELLVAAGVEFEINERLVRGLDYYCNTVFEWVTEGLGAQGTLCAGGRYDGLLEQLGGKPAPAIGFALGLERLVLLLQSLDLLEEEKNLDAYIVARGENADREALLVAELLRNMSLRVVIHAGEASFKSQLKKADKSGAVFSIILGEEEISNSQISIKFLREKKGQLTVSRSDLEKTIKAMMSE